MFFLVGAAFATFSNLTHNTALESNAQFLGSTVRKLKGGDPNFHRTVVNAIWPYLNDLLNTQIAEMMPPPMKGLIDVIVELGDTPPIMGDVIFKEVTKKDLQLSIDISAIISKVYIYSTTTGWQLGTASDFRGAVKPLTIQLNGLTSEPPFFTSFEVYLVDQPELDFSVDIDLFLLGQFDVFNAFAKGMAKESANLVIGFLMIQRSLGFRSYEMDKPEVKPKPMTVGFTHRDPLALVAMQPLKSRGFSSSNIFAVVTCGNFQWTTEKFSEVGGNEFVVYGDEISFSSLHMQINVYEDSSSYAGDWKGKGSTLLSAAENGVWMDIVGWEGKSAGQVFVHVCITPVSHGKSDTSVGGFLRARVDYYKYLGTDLMDFVGDIKVVATWTGESEKEEQPVFQPPVPALPVQMIHWSFLSPVQDLQKAGVQIDLVIGNILAASSTNSGTNVVAKVRGSRAEMQVTYDVFSVQPSKCPRVKKLTPKNGISWNSDILRLVPYGREGWTTPEFKYSAVQSYFTKILIGSLVFLVLACIFGFCMARFIMRRRLRITANIPQNQPANIPQNQPLVKKRK